VHRSVQLMIIGAAAIHATTAYANPTLQLPNGISVPYYGPYAPLLYRHDGTLVGTYYAAIDTTNGHAYYYSSAGDWIGVQQWGSPSQPLDSLPNRPQIPTSVTLPNGSVVPYQGIGIPQIITHPNNVFGPFSVIDIVTGRNAAYSATGQGTSASSGGLRPNWGVLVNDGSSGSGGTGGTGGTDGGATNVPEPGLFGLFGLGAAALVLRRRRRKASRDDELSKS
jgi:hypothetical protein